MPQFYAIRVFIRIDRNFRRDEEVNGLYEGKVADPLSFLRRNNISMVTIWPDDHIDPTVVTKLQQELALDYTYVDCRGFHPDSTTPQCGIFIKKSFR